MELLNQGRQDEEEEEGEGEKKMKKEMKEEAREKEKKDEEFFSFIAAHISRLQCSNCSWKEADVSRNKNRPP